MTPPKDDPLSGLSQDLVEARRSLTPAGTLAVLADMEVALRGMLAHKNIPEESRPQVEDLLHQVLQDRELYSEKLRRETRP